MAMQFITLPGVSTEEAGVCGPDGICAVPERIEKAASDKSASRQSPKAAKTQNDAPAKKEGE